MHAMAGWAGEARSAELVMSHGPETGKAGWNTLEDKKAGWGAPGAGAARGSSDQCMYTYIYI